MSCKAARCLTRPPLRLADTLSDFWGPMGRFESDQKSDFPRERAVYPLLTSDF